MVQWHKVRFSNVDWGDATRGIRVVQTTIKKTRRINRLSSERAKCLRTRPPVYPFFIAIKSVHFTLVFFTRALIGEYCTTYITNSTEETRIVNIASGTRKAKLPDATLKHVVLKINNWDMRLPILGRSLELKRTVLLPNTWQLLEWCWERRRSRIHHQF